MTVLEYLGGPKFLMTVLALILIALRGALKLDDTTINVILAVALGGSGVLHAKDTVAGVQEARATAAEEEAAAPPPTPKDV